jgi:hypothetical protein
MWAKIILMCYNLKDDLCTPLSNGVKLTSAARHYHFMQMV